MIRQLLVAIAAFLCIASARAADAPYVPTPDNVVSAMFKLAGVGASDYLIDLGSGDGRIVIAAARQYGASGLGVELDASLVTAARREAARQGVAGRAQFVADDIFFMDFSKASVVTLYLGESVNQRLRPALFKLAPGTRVVSHDFGMGNWAPDDKLTVPVPGKGYGPPSSDVLLWVVPADFSGNWRWQSESGEPVETVFEQTFQRVGGRATVAGRTAVVERVQARGDSLHFVLTAGNLRREYRGHISGDTITGTAVTIGASPSGAVVSGPGVPWRAIRSARGRINIEAEAQTFGSGISTKE